MLSGEALGIEEVVWHRMVKKESKLEQRVPCRKKAPFGQSLTVCPVSLWSGRVLSALSLTCIVYPICWRQIQNTKWLHLGSSITHKLNYLLHCCLEVLPKNTRMSLSGIAYTTVLLNISHHDISCHGETATVWTFEQSRLWICILEVWVHEKRFLEGLNVLGA